MENSMNIRKRLIVMNGQKIAQNDSSGDWKTEKLTKDGGIKPGIYNLYTAVDADKSKDNIGEVIHIDKKENTFYQKNESEYIKHNLKDFDSIPETGRMMSITYKNDKTNISEVAEKHSQKNQF